MEKLDQELNDVNEVLRDLSIMMGNTNDNREGRRAAKARLRKQIKKAKKKVAAGETV